MEYIKLFVVIMKKDMLTFCWLLLPSKCKILNLPCPVSDPIKYKKFLLKSAIYWLQGSLPKDISQKCSSSHNGKMWKQRRIKTLNIKTILTLLCSVLPLNFSWLISAKRMIFLNDYIIPFKKKRASKKQRWAAKNRLPSTRDTRYFTQFLRIGSMDLYRIFSRNPHHRVSVPPLLGSSQPIPASPGCWEQQEPMRLLQPFLREVSATWWKLHSRHQLHRHPETFA